VPDFLDLVAVTDQQKWEGREEAERLKALDLETQRQVIAIHRATADDPRATRADRRTAKERAKGPGPFWSGSGL
jgi:hypothetical protein